jgi:hydrogenase maturation protease
MQIAVIGVGQSMRGDDAAGMEAVQLWKSTHSATSHHPSLRVEVAELPGLAVLDFLDGMDAAILVDAIRTGSAPGTLHRLSPERLAAFKPDSKSAHGWGVAETLHLASLLDTSGHNPSVRVIGIEVAQLQVGSSLSEVVRKALPGACAAIQEEVETLLGN